MNYGVAIDDVATDVNRYPYWGTYNPDHVYDVDVVGTGQPISVGFHDDDYDDNYQMYSNLKIEIFEQLPGAAPPAPTNLAAIPQGGNAINLSWSTDGSGATQEYLIYRNTTDTQPSSVFATVLAGSGDTQSYVDASSLNGTYTYYYWVEASTDGVTEWDSPLYQAAMQLGHPHGLRGTGIFRAKI